MTCHWNIGMEEIAQRTNPLSRMLLQHPHHHPRTLLRPRPHRHHHPQPHNQLSYSKNSRHHHHRLHQQRRCQLVGLKVAVYGKPQLYTWKYTAHSITQPASPIASWVTHLCGWRCFASLGIAWLCWIMPRGTKVVRKESGKLCWQDCWPMRQGQVGLVRDR